MQPVNTKSLLAFIFGTMNKLDRGEIDPNTACAQAKLAAQAHNILDYELKRTIVQMRLQEAGRNITPELRDVESKAFDNAKAKTIPYENQALLSERPAEQPRYADEYAASEGIVEG